MSTDHTITMNTVYLKLTKVHTILFLKRSLLKTNTYSTCSAFRNSHTSHLKVNKSYQCILTMNSGQMKPAVNLHSNAVNIIMYFIIKSAYNTNNTRIC